MHSRRPFLVLLALAGGTVALGAPAVVAATVNGTNRADVLRGTDRSDLIRAYAGDDIIVARGGNDEVRTGPGADIVWLGAGADHVLNPPAAYGGDDVVHAG